jgi:hypothetical protein
MGMKKDILQKTEEKQLIWYAMSCAWSTAKLLGRLQNGTHRRKSGAERQTSERAEIRDSVQSRNLKSFEGGGNLWG